MIQVHGSGWAGIIAGNRASFLSQYAAESNRLRFELYPMM